MRRNNTGMSHWPFFNHGIQAIQVAGWLCLVLLMGCWDKGDGGRSQFPEKHVLIIHYDTLTAKVKVGESFLSIARGLQLPPQESSQLLNSIKENFRFKLFAGQTYRVIYKSVDSTRDIEAFILDDRYEDKKHILVKTNTAILDSTFSKSENLASNLSGRTPATFIYQMLNIPVRTDTVSVSGNLSSNLYDAFLSKGESPALIQLVTKIFAWDIDFFKDPRVGDAFNLLVEKRFGEDGGFRGYGKVLSAKYVNRSKDFYGILYNGSYFDKSGGSLEKMLLKAPLNFAHISSGFTSSRLHPILGVNRPHWGIDYAAPKGTKIFAAGDGTVEYAKWVNGYGKTLKIRHNGVYNTYYAHLNGFATGMCAGRRVHQGETVAFLGMTGLATGPHLDYRVECHGKYINPAELKMEAKGGVAKDEWKSFCDQRDLLLARMVSSEANHFASN